MRTDIQDYFICPSMECFTYTKILFRWISKEIHIQYNLSSIIEPNSYVYYELGKVMYRLKQAAHITFNNLVNVLAPQGYLPI